MARHQPLPPGQMALTSCARVLVRGGADEQTGETLTPAVLAERISWCASLVQGMAAGLAAGHWNADDLRHLASGADAQGRALPASAWMALRRLGWTPALPPGVTVSDRVIRMAQEQTGRALRSAAWRDSIVTAVLAAWPASPAKRTPEDWDAVRAAIPGGGHVPSAVIRARTRQIARFAAASGPPC